MNYTQDEKENFEDTKVREVIRSRNSGRQTIQQSIEGEQTIQRSIEGDRQYKSQ